ncbi:phosphonate metabolism protein/1,5-bisphosphokinase (PRPP-forming) PhnN [Cryobacterium frigoriphilum]|uniref:Ribose 1,5-bisphosphate phosphokinase PhnN n=1 Tax=Cryobacterium frigoriphilum TaxID=1259150 RepID=A0A4R8ZUG0_9MICO|nr:phosphonate metabolism protein/1,5-bisphosphokinase (PRPP-forming) PhnN [Cryobacterium frigoriphilum]TFD45954.1 phosphonate metabolism protein/1,5-bisphosphokinase (PRPP-forming) PhnN [Cryobacterium frigoriphilum]
MSGTFVAVVGPSGSGKDSILESARVALIGQGDIVFAQRRITRPASAGEDHHPVGEDEFDAALSRGEFALTWQAHGLRYGIPAHLVDVVASGGVVVANVSRGVLDQLPAVFTTVRVARVTVSEEVRLTRILARGRENAAAAAARVARPDPAPDFAVDLEIVNDGTLDEASAAFAAFLWQVRNTVRTPR